MSPDAIGITGATGAVGGQVAQAVAAAGFAPTLIVRDATRAPAIEGSKVATADYRDGAAMRAALAGLKTLLLVSASESEDRLDVHLSAVDAAADVGIERVVYTSFLGAAEDATFTLAREHWATEQRIRERGLGFTFLRDNMYAAGVPFLVGPDFVMRCPTGTGRVSLVSRQDIIAVAVRAVLDHIHAGRTYEVTGPRALSMEDVAEALTRVTGRPVAFMTQTVEEAYSSRAAYKPPAWQLEAWVTSSLAIANGEMATVSNDVQAVIGRPPLDLEEVLRANPTLWHHLAVPAVGV